MSLSSRQTAPSRALQAPGFFVGFVQVFVALRFLARNPNTWPLSLVPAVLFAVLSAAGTMVGWLWLTPWVLGFFSAPDSWWLTAAHWFVKAVLYLASIIVGVWTALVLTPPLSGPALEGLVSAQEQELQLPERASVGWAREFVYGLKAQLLAVAFAAPLVIGLSLLELVVAPLAIVTTPLKFVITALALAWNLFDYPLTLRGVGASERLGFVVQHWPTVLGFGLGFVLLFWIPCFGVLMLPVGVVAATRLLYLLLEAEPSELTQLPRPPTPPVFGPSAAQPVGHRPTRT